MALGGHAPDAADDPPRPPAPSVWEATRLVPERRGPRYDVDVARGRFPYSLVWTPLPGITWLLPCVGHLGVTDSRGVCYDFAGPYSIGVDDLAFGRPMIVVPLDPERATARRPGGKSPQEAWDAAVDAGNDVYCQRMHNIFCDKCVGWGARLG